ncbi:MAG TPA: DUF2470 domain-containing protein [Arenibaculum sp.]|nr:DUF2470 domain-containing protein [Arenibaculum sp.]
MTPSTGNGPIAPSGSGMPAVGRPAEEAPALRARRLMRGVDRAALATVYRSAGDRDAETGDAEGWPYPSLVLVAHDHDGSPLLLLSDLADHSRNIKADPRVGLLFDATAGLAEPLAGARVSVLGRAARTHEPRHRERFLRRHPGAASYAGFRDFAVLRVEMDRAHLVAGFGRIHWIDRRDLPFSSGDPGPLAAAEADAVRHMNEDHSDTLELYATALLGRSGGGWTLTGIDPEGCDLRRGGEVARLDFEFPATDAESARRELAGLARTARRKQSAPVR